jgi:hypothetical protein
MRVFYYNDECQYCRSWARWCEARVGTQIQFDPLPPDDPKTSPKYIDDDGVVFLGARGVFEMLSFSKRWRWLRTLYRFVPGFAPVSEWAFAYLSKCPVCASKFTRFILKS